MGRLKQASPAARVERETQHSARGAHLYGVTSLSGNIPIAAVRGAAAGDEAAFAQIVAACHDDMVRVAYGVCEDIDLARDSVQSAWVIAWRKLATVRDPERVRPWLIAVTANEARQAVRRRRSAQVTWLEVDPPGDAGHDPADGFRDVDLVNALHHLTADERRLVALRYLAGLDSAEIGRQLGISASGVRARLSRTLVRLRKDLDDD